MGGVRIRAFVLIAGLVLSVALEAQDQRLRDRDPDLDAAKRLAEDLQRANLHLGPLYLLSRIRISDAGYSDGALLPAGDGGGLSLNVDAPQRLYFVPRRKVMFSADFVPGYSFIGDGGNQFNYLVRGDAHLLFNHLYLDVYAQSADQLRAHVSDINTIATTKENEYGVAGEVKYSSRTSGLFAVRSRSIRYPADRYQPEFEELDFNPIDLLDRRETNVRASAVHKTFPLTSLFLAGETSDYSFRYATFKDGRRLWFGGGFLYDNGRTIVRGEAGPLSLRFDDPNQNGFSGATGNLRASRTAGRTTYLAHVERDLGFSVFSSNNYFVADRAAVSVQRSATPRLTLRAGSAYEIDRYETRVRGTERRDTISFTSVGFLYRIRSVNAGVDVGWFERDSTSAGDRDSGIRYVLNLSYTP